VWFPFGWIRRRRLARRELLRYWDGTRTRYGDPFLLWRALTHHDTIQLGTHWDAAENGEEPATTELVTATAEIFGVSRFVQEATGTASGLTDWELMGLLEQLVDYIDALKKKHNPQPTSSPPTDSESSTSPGPPNEAENSGSASG